MSFTIGFYKDLKRLSHFLNKSFLLLHYCLKTSRGFVSWSFLLFLDAVGSLGRYVLRFLWSQVSGWEYSDFKREHWCLVSQMSATEMKQPLKPNPPRSPVEAIWLIISTTLSLLALVISQFTSCRAPRISGPARRWLKKSKKRKKGIP